MEWLSEVSEKELNYWRKQLGENGPAVLDMLYDKPRPKQQTFVGKNHRLDIPIELLSSLDDICKRGSVTMYMLLLVMFQLLLSRYSRQEEVCV